MKEYKAIKSLRDIFLKDDAQAIKLKRVFYNNRFYNHFNNIFSDINKQ